MVRQSRNKNVWELGIRLLQERERKHLGDFLGDYDDNKDDQKYYKYVSSCILCVVAIFLPFRGSAYGRRRRERDMEMDSDDRDRNRERDELEELRLQVTN